MKLVFSPPAAYGDYNDATIEVANARNQKLVNWDFEYELFSFFVRRTTSLLMGFFFPVQFGRLDRYRTGKPEKVV
jgi:hypothetical protein